jgi:hypothetical protein
MCSSGVLERRSSPEPQRSPAAAGFGWIPRRSRVTGIRRTDEGEKGFIMNNSKKSTGVIVLIVLVAIPLAVVVAIVGAALMGAIVGAWFLETPFKEGFLEVWAQPWKALLFSVLFMGGTRGAAARRTK